jgi:hypothetical protein
MTDDLATLVARVKAARTAQDWIWAADITEENEWRFSRSAAVAMLNRFVDAYEKEMLGDGDGMQT